MFVFSESLPGFGTGMMMALRHVDGKVPVSQYLLSIVRRSCKDTHTHTHTHTHIYIGDELIIQLIVSRGEANIIFFMNSFMWLKGGRIMIWWRIVHDCVSKSISYFLGISNGVIINLYKRKKTKDLQWRVRSTIRMSHN